jgi:hypothetical protein
MKKELLMILLIIGLPTFFIMSFGPAMTGGVVNELSQMRVDRINLALQFPQSLIPMLKQPSYDSRKYLIQGANEHYFDPTGLMDGNGFFFQERQLIPALLQLMCLQGVGEVNSGRYVSYQGLPVYFMGNLWYGKELPYLGKVLCDFGMQNIAHTTLKKVFELDYNIIDYTIEHSNCPDVGKDKVALSQQYLATGQYEAALDSMQGAWMSAQNC